MARTRRRRRNSGLFKFVGDIFDDVRDLLDDEILDRSRDTERDVHRSARNWTDEDFGRPIVTEDGFDRDTRGRWDGRDRNRAARRHRRESDVAPELRELRAAIEQLTRHVEELESAAPTRSRAGTAA